MFTAMIVQTEVLLLDPEDGDCIVLRHVAVHPQGYTKPTENTSICLNVLVLDCRSLSVAVLKHTFVFAVMDGAVTLLESFEMSA